MRHKYKIVIIAAALSLGVVGCASRDENHKAHSNQNTNHTNRGAEHSGMVHTSLDPNAKFKAEMTTNPSTVEAGKPVTLNFMVKNEKGEAVKDLQIVHEQLMHLLIVSDDLAQFEHLHPERQVDGTFKVSFTFPNGGGYKLYADYTPKDAHQVVDRFDVKVNGPEKQKEALVEDANLTKRVDGLTVTMKPNKTLRVGDEVMIDFVVTDAQTGKPVADLQNYLGELAHFVIINEDASKFLHVHPMSGNSGHSDTKHDGKHNEMKMKASNSSKATIRAHTTFPTAGLYKLWAQFQREGRVITVPFVIRIAEGDKAEMKKKEAKENLSGAIKITVSNRGYEPSTIKVEKGKPVKLAFYRKTAENCGDEVVFSSLGIRKKIPVDQTVIVELTPKEAGELTFACGMGMLRGKLIVQ